MPINDKIRVSVQFTLKDDRITNFQISMYFNAFAYEFDGNI